MAGRNVKAERILAGLFGLFVSFIMLTKSVQVLGQALRLRADLPSHPGLHPEVKEAFVTFALELTIGLFLAWWGIGKLRRLRPVSKALKSKA